ncbi:MAG: alpha/beta fold hydrolase [Deltaproteobacteria bacterium]|nr:alpha/beta fold hydrolase [Deltaproteobacteria bacterium]
MTAFDLDGDDAGLGVVLLHGFTGTPYEVRYLGEQLARAGFAVRAPLLPGHGTSLADLDRTTWRDWAAHVDRAIEAVAARGRRVAVVGQSLGGLLALHAASLRPQVEAVATLAAPVWLEGLSARVASWAERGLLPVRAIPKLGGSDVRDRRVRAENPCYPAIPVKALGELCAFMRVADAALPRITQPVLVLHAHKDHTAPVACATHIAERTRARRLRILPRSYHLIAADVERDIVAAEVIGFLRKGGTACAT